MDTRYMVERAKRGPLADTPYHIAWGCMACPKPASVFRPIVEHDYVAAFCTDHIPAWLKKSVHG